MHIDILCCHALDFQENISCVSQCNYNSFTMLIISAVCKYCKPLNGLWTDEGNHSNLVMLLLCLTRIVGIPKILALARCISCYVMHIFQQLSYVLIIKVPYLASILVLNSLYGNFKSSGCNVFVTEPITAMDISAKEPSYVAVAGRKSK